MILPLMKILAFTDVHASEKAMEHLREKSRDADILVCCGDLTTFGRELSFYLEQLDSFGKEVLIVHGNHEDSDEVEALCANLPNLTFIHERVIKRNGITFIGFGGGGFSEHEIDFGIFASEHEDELQFPIIFVTHAPPRDCRLDCLPIGNVGVYEYREFIDTFHPVFSVFGHLHEFAGEEDRIGETAIINPGPTGRFLTFPQTKA